MIENEKSTGWWVKVCARCAVAGALAAGAEVVVHPIDDGRALVNPGMGWTMHYYSNVPHNYGSYLEPGDSAAWFPGCSTVYLRIPWAYLEPEEGVYNWAALDTPAQRWIERGGQIAFRITTAESWLEYATPKWVFDAGAKGVRYNWGRGPTGDLSSSGKLVDPDYVDPVFLAKLEAFMKVFGARYNGRPEVAFVDVGTYGTWGEGHTGGASRVPQEKMNEDVKKHIDLHVKYFPRTPIVISDDVAGPSNPADDPPLLAYARSRGVGWRDDSILVQPPPRSWYHAKQAEHFWRTLPIVLEHEHYGSSKLRKAWDGELLVKSVEDHHASFMSIHWNPRPLLDENRAVIDRINRRLGYRFQAREIAWPEAVSVKGTPFEIRWSWANAGVAPCLADAYPCLTVKDEKGGVQAVLVDSAFNLRSLPVAAPGQASAKAHRFTVRLGRWAAPTFKTGVFTVYVSVGKVDGTPVYELPLPGADGHRRYKVGTIEFQERN